MSEPISQPANPPPAPGATRRLGRWLRAGGWRAFAGAAAGAAGLATYAHFIGCRGSCFLTADVHTATAAGALVGLVIGWPAPAKADGAPSPAKAGGSPAQQPQ